MRLHTLAFGLLVWPAGAAIADNVADFYRGKTVTMVVGTPAAGATTFMPDCWYDIWPNTSPAIPPSSFRTSQEPARSLRQTTS
jgi:hypothetical protein